MYLALYHKNSFEFFKISFYLMTKKHSPNEIGINLFVTGG